jgi:hypothetical protein
MIRVIAAACGALFGAVGATILFLVQEHAPIDWKIVALVAVITGGLAAAFGKRFWDTSLGLWP